MLNTVSFMYSQIVRDVSTISVHERCRLIQICTDVWLYSVNKSLLYSDWGKATGRKRKVFGRYKSGKMMSIKMFANLLIQ